MPSFIFGGAAVPGIQGLGGYPHVPSLVVSSFDASSSPLRPLPRQDVQSLSDSDLSQSFGLPGQFVAPPDVNPVPLVDLPGTPGPVPPTPMPSSSTWSEPFRLVKLKDAKAYLDNYDLIQYYLHISDFSTGCSEGVLQTDPSNAEASRIWEGQICLAVKDSSLRFLFDSKGDLFHGHGFKMLVTLDQHCHPNTVSNAFSSLLSLFNEVQGDNEPILEYRSCFDGLILDMLRCKVAIPQILLVMLFLWALNSCYTSILEQFWTRFNSLDTATVDSVVKDVTHCDTFKVVEYDKGKKTPTPRVLAAASAVTDPKSNVYHSPFNWLVKWGHKGIKTRWTWALAGMGICSICHRDEKPWHVPAHCPLLKELNLKLIHGPPSSSAPVPAQAPAPVASAPAPSPGGRVGATDSLTSTGSSGPGTVPSGMAVALDAVVEYDSDDDFCWAGDEEGLGYCGVCPPAKSHASVAPYSISPSCNHVQVEMILPQPSVEIPPVA